MTARRVVVLLLAAGMALIGPLLIVMTGSTVWNDLSKARRQFEIKNMKDTYGLAQNDVVASAHERGSQLRIMYNRVGKCGSRTTIELLKVLSVQNKFTLTRSDINNQKVMSVEDQIDLVNYINKLPPPFVYCRHVYYIDFQKMGAEPLIHINIIRDPVERFVSSYYFKRFGDGRGYHGFESIMRKKWWREMTIDECVHTKNVECMPDKLFYIIPYFCGQDPGCLEPNKWALERAKVNVIEKFLVVGLLEEYEETLKVFERLLPRHFKGIFDLYKHQGTLNNMTDTATRKKVMPLHRTQKTLRSRMQLDYEFYHFVRNRFHALKRQLGIGHS
eukprot:m.190338 g.190338  ORF g.190338 m.190338 type:complete len:331 (+) comp39431_c0_seq41:107-1099(+)